MFELRTFIKETLFKMAEKEDEYKVRQYAISWYDKGVLLQEDLSEVEKLYAIEENIETGDNTVEENNTN